MPLSDIPEDNIQESIAKFDEITQSLTDPKVTKDQRKFAALTKQYKRLSILLAAHKEYLTALDDKEAAMELKDLSTDEAEKEALQIEAHKYIINGKLALGWIQNCYGKTIDKKESGIENDPNNLFEDSSDSIKLIEQVTELSLKTLETVDNLPKDFK